MKCITVKQPWATLLVVGATQYLVRSWRTKYRGPLAIHASATFPRANFELCCDEVMRHVLRQYGYDYAIELPTQAVLGTIIVDDCLRVEEDNSLLFDPEDPAAVFGHLQWERWAWLCTNPRALPHPIPRVGRLGIYSIPDALVGSSGSLGAG
jgi:hypothetical protein